MPQRFIGVDVGGTKVSVAVLEGSTLSDPILRPTVLDSSDGLINQLAGLIDEQGPAEAVGIGVPSVIDFATGPPPPPANPATRSTCRCRTCPCAASSPSACGCRSTSTTTRRARRWPRPTTR